MSLIASIIDSISITIYALISFFVKIVIVSRSSFVIALPLSNILKINTITCLLLIVLFELYLIYRNLDLFLLDIYLFCELIFMK